MAHRASFTQPTEKQIAKSKDRKAQSQFRNIMTLFLYWVRMLFLCISPLDTQTEVDGHRLPPASIHRQSIYALIHLFVAASIVSSSPVCMQKGAR